MKNQHPIFISYARLDGDSFADLLEQELTTNGFRIWRDTRDIDYTKDFTSEIERAIEASLCLIVCLTEDVNRSDGFVRREITYAQTIGKSIIVARFHDVTSPIHIVNLTWVDFHANWDQALTKLVSILEQIVASPQLLKHLNQEFFTNDVWRPYLEQLLDNTVDFLDKAVIRPIDLATEKYPRSESPFQRRESNFDLLFEAQGIKSPKKGIFPYRNFVEAFEAYDGRVLLVGNAGAGKTITLMAFTRDATYKRLADPTNPLPLLGLISTWDADEKFSISDWLSQGVQSLKPQDVETEINAGNVLLLLDGLDELGDRRIDKKTKQLYDPRQRFIDFINSVPTNNHAVITCRSEDYSQISSDVALNGSVSLLPLSERQMHDFLEDQPVLWTAVQQDPELKKILQTPLIMSLFAYAFRELPLESAELLRDFSKSPGELSDKIMDKYVQQRYEWEKRRLSRMTPKQDMPVTIEKLNARLKQIAVADSVGDSVTWIYRDIDMNDLRSSTELAKGLAILNENQDYDARFSHLKIRDYYAFDGLINMLLEDDRSHYREKAARALGRLRDRRSTKALLTALHDDVGPVRYTVAEAIRQTKDPQAVEPLIHSLSKLEEIFQRATIFALGGLNDSRGVDTLISVLRNSSPAVRICTAGALGEIGDARAVKPLISLLEDKGWHLIEASLGDPFIRVARTFNVSGYIVPEAAWSTEDDPRAYVVQDFAAVALEMIGTDDALVAVEKWRKGGKK